MSKHPDIYIRCLPEDVTLGAERIKLVEGSKVFNDMFSTCDSTSTSPTSSSSSPPQTIDLYESSSAFTCLLRLLHAPPPPPPAHTGPSSDDESDAFETKITPTTPKSSVPLPLLPSLYALADKYVVTDAITHALHTHLASYKSASPLRVYALAARLGLDDLVNETSVYLLHPPLSAYTVEEVSVIPSTGAYHKLLLLQSHREKKLKEILLGEEIFPHGYGECPEHRSATMSMWDQRRNEIVGRIESGSDVAAEMEILLSRLRGCAKCHTACSAAIDMLRYKCRRVARRIDRIPATSSS